MKTIKTKKEKTMQTEVTKSEPTKNALTLGDRLQQEEDFRPEDLQAPQITLLQSTSDLVKDKTYQVGDVVRGGTLLEDLTIVPLTYRKQWIISEHTGGKPRGEWRGTRAMDAGLNDTNLSIEDRTGYNLPFKFDVEGKEYRRTKLLEVFCLLKSDLDAGMAIPSVLWLKKGAYNRGGKGVMSHFAFQRAADLQPEHSLLTLLKIPRKNEDGDWLEFGVKPSGLVDKKHYAIIDKWKQLVKSNSVASEVAADTGESVAVTKESRF
jgi:hypothetical protein